MDCDSDDEDDKNLTPMNHDMRKHSILAPSTYRKRSDTAKNWSMNGTGNTSYPPKYRKQDSFDNTRVSPKQQEVKFTTTNFEFKYSEYSQQETRKERFSGRMSSLSTPVKTSNYTPFPKVLSNHVKKIPSTQSSSQPMQQNKANMDMNLNPTRGDAAHSPRVIQTQEKQVFPTKQRAQVCQSEANKGKQYSQQNYGKCRSLAYMDMQLSGKENTASHQPRVMKNKKQDCSTNTISTSPVKMIKTSSSDRSSENFQHVNGRSCSLDLNQAAEHTGTSEFPKVIAKNMQYTTSLVRNNPPKQRNFQVPYNNKPSDHSQNENGKQFILKDPRLNSAVIVSHAANSKLSSPVIPRREKTDEIPVKRSFPVMQKAKQACPQENVKARLDDMNKIVKVTGDTVPKDRPMPKLEKLVISKVNSSQHLGYSDNQKKGSSATRDSFEYMCSVVLPIPKDTPKMPTKENHLPMQKAKMSQAVADDSKNLKRSEGDSKKKGSMAIENTATPSVIPPQKKRKISIERSCSPAKKAKQNPTGVKSGKHLKPLPLYLNKNKGFNGDINKHMDITPSPREPMRPAALLESAKELTGKERLNAWIGMYESLEFGIKVQCVACNKWRFVKQYNEPHEVPNVWKCSDNLNVKQNTCSVPEDTMQATFMKTKFIPGSLVWAKMSTYPWWPAMVEEDPLKHEFYCSDQKSLELTHYHVTFLGKEVNRAWILKGNVRHFNIGPLSTTKPKFMEDLAFSKGIAMEAIKLNLSGRLKRYSFVLNYTEPDEIVVLKKKRGNAKEKDCNASNSGVSDEQSNGRGKKQVKKARGLLNPYVLIKALPSGRKM